MSLWVVGSMRIRKLKTIENEVKPIKYDITGYLLETSYDRKDKRRVLISRDISGINTVIKKAKITGKTDKIKFGSKTFQFDISKPLYRSRNTWIYGLNVDTGQQTISQSVQTISAALTDTILVRHVIKDLVSGLEKLKVSEILIYIVLAVIAGISTGVVIGQNV